MLVDVWDERKAYSCSQCYCSRLHRWRKSVTTLNIIQQLLEQNVKVIVVEFGKSFYQLGQIYQDRTPHIDYNPETPLGINPFYIPEGTKPDKDKPERWLI